MNRLVITSALLALALPHAASATDPINAGNLRALTLRQGYVMFKVISSDGTNQCAPCPYDPGNMGAGGYCWIAETDSPKLSVLLLARAQESMISGRVTDMATNCTVYQLTMND